MTPGCDAVREVGVELVRPGGGARDLGHLEPRGPSGGRRGPWRGASPALSPAMASLHGRHSLMMGGARRARGCRDSPRRPGGAADEQAVDMRAGDQFLAVARVDAAAVEARARGARGCPRATSAIARLAVVGIVRGRPGCRSRRWPRPARRRAGSRACFWSPDELASAPSTSRCQHRVGAARLALGQRLADADQRDQPVADGGLGLQADRLVGLAEMLAPLGVAELDEVERRSPSASAARSRRSRRRRRPSACSARRP